LSSLVTAHKTWQSAISTHHHRHHQKNLQMPVRHFLPASLARSLLGSNEPLEAFQPFEAISV
jgi:hypothetical protein